jgi:enamine deaminase RidA (YjgF/YER057c/UK114 family)
MKKSINKILALALAAVMVLTLLPATAFAAESVSYIDGDGGSQSVSATAVTNSDTTWTNGWYYVSGNVTIDHSVEVTGDVKLILADSAHLTVTSAGNLAAIQVEAAYTNEAAGVNQAEACRFTPKAAARAS